MIDLVVCSCEDSGELGFTVFLNGVCVIYSPDKMKLRMMMDQLQMILAPLSLHFVICVDFLKIIFGFYFLILLASF